MLCILLAVATSADTGIEATVSVSSSLSLDTTQGAGTDDSSMMQTLAPVDDHDMDGLWRLFLFLFLMIVIAAGLLNHYKKHRGGAVERELFQDQLTMTINMSTEKKSKIFTASNADGGHRPAVSKDEYDTPDVVLHHADRDDILSTERIDISMSPAYKIAVEGMEGQLDREPADTARQTSTGANERYEFMKWLGLLDLKDYYTELVGSGYTCAADLTKISEQSELVDIGIDDEEDRLTLWCEIVDLQRAETVERSEPR